MAMTSKSGGRLALAVAAALLLWLAAPDGAGESFAVPQNARALGAGAQRPMAGRARTTRNVLTLPSPQMESKEPPRHWLALLGLSTLFPALCATFFKGTAMLNHAMTFLPPWGRAALYVSLAGFFWGMEQSQLFSKSTKAWVQAACSFFRRFKLTEWRVEVLSKTAGPLANIMQSCLIFLAFNLLVNAIPDTATFALPRMLSVLDVNHTGVLTAPELEALAYSVAGRMLVGFIALQAAIFVLRAKEPPTSEMPEPKALVAKFLRGLQRLEAKDMTYTQSREALIVQCVDRGLSVGSWLFVIVTWLTLANLKFSQILAMGGVGGLAFSLAATNIVKNLISGVLMFSHHAVNEGDQIMTMGGAIRGVVDSINPTNTVIHRLAGEPLIVPNSMLSDSAIINLQQRDYFHIDTYFPLQLDSFVNLPEVVAAMQKKLEEEIEPHHSSHLPGKHRIYADPIVYFDGYGPNGATVKIEAYVDGAMGPWKFNKLKSEILCALSSTALSFKGVEYGFQANQVGGGKA